MAERHRHRRYMMILILGPFRQLLVFLVQYLRRYFLFFNDQMIKVLHELLGLETSNDLQNIASTYGCPILVGRELLEA